MGRMVRRHWSVSRVCVALESFANYFLFFANLFLFFDRELTGLICAYRLTPWLHVRYFRFELTLCPADCEVANLLSFKFISLQKLRRFLLILCFTGITNSCARLHFRFFFNGSGALRAWRANGARRSWRASGARCVALDIQKLSAFIVNKVFVTHATRCKWHQWRMAPR